MSGEQVAMSTAPRGPWEMFQPEHPMGPWDNFRTGKEREWSDVPLDALKTIPSSTIQFAQNLVHPILHPIDTAKSLVSLGDAIGSKISRPGDLLREGDAAPTAEQLQARQQREAPADAVGQFFKARYGSEGGIKDTLATDPVGAAADLATVISGGAAIAGRAAPTLSTAMARAGSVVDPLTLTGNAVKGVGKVTEPIISNALGVTTGAGRDSVRAAGRAGLEGNPVFAENMRGKVPMSDAVNMAHSATDQMRAARSADYQAGMGTVKADKTVLDFEPIDKALAQTSQIGSFEGRSLNNAVAETQSKLAAKIDEWRTSDPARFHTPEGFDALKQSIGAIREETLPHTQARIVADRVYREVGDAIKAQAPEYAKTMADYAKASDQLKEVARTFSLKEGASQDTALRKLQSVMRNNVNTNYGERAKLAEVLAQYEPNLPAAIAGQAMNSATPRGLSKLNLGPIAAGAYFDPTLLATLPATSPRMVGEAAYLGGRAVGGINRLAEAMAINAPNVRAAGQGIYQGGRADNENQGALARALLRANERKAR